MKHYGQTKRYTVKKRKERKVDPKTFIKPTVMTLFYLYLKDFVGDVVFLSFTVHFFPEVSSFLRSTNIFPDVS